MPTTTTRKASRGELINDTFDYSGWWLCCSTRSDEFVLFIVKPQHESGNGGLLMFSTDFNQFNFGYLLASNWSYFQVWMLSSASIQLWAGFLRRADQNQNSTPKHSSELLEWHEYCSWSSFKGVEWMLTAINIAKRLLSSMATSN